MNLSFRDYGKVGSTVWERSYTQPIGEGWIAMKESRPAEGAIAQEDGTWLVPSAPDLTLGEAENIVTMFPVSYGYVLRLMGVSDVV